MCLQNFWTRLASKYGNKFFWQEQGEASAMLNAVRRRILLLDSSGRQIPLQHLPLPSMQVSAVSNCLHEPIGRGQCSNIRGMEVPLESLF